MTTLTDQLRALAYHKHDDLSIATDAANEIERLRAALYEVTTNGAWTEGEQRGDWKISKEVYETARDALS